MKIYPTFVSAYILSIIGIIVCSICYFYNFINFMSLIQAQPNIENPAIFFQELFSPSLIIALVISAIASLLYLALGIAMVVRKPGIESVQLILWILGFLMAGIITGLVFIIVSKSMNLRPPYQPTTSNIT